jgi:hypothetical protein
VTLVGIGRSDCRWSVALALRRRNELGRRGLDIGSGKERYTVAWSCLPCDICYCLGRHGEGSLQIRRSNRQIALALSRIAV